MRPLILGFVSTVDELLFLMLLMRNYPLLLKLSQIVLRLDYLLIFLFGKATLVLPLVFLLLYGSSGLRLQKVKGISKVRGGPLLCPGRSLSYLTSVRDPTMLETGVNKRPLVWTLLQV